MSEDLSSLPPEVVELANEVASNLLPPKSREVYECAYNRFMQWCSQKSIESYSETVLLAYFGNLSAKLKSSTLWSQYSMVKSMLNLKNGVDISKFPKLLAFLKRQGDGYKPKKARVLTNEQVDQFLSAAPDKDYLMIKVCVLISNNKVRYIRDFFLLYLGCLDNRACGCMSL